MAQPPTTRERLKKLAAEVSANTAAAEGRRISQRELETFYLYEKEYIQFTAEYVARREAIEKRIVNYGMEAGKYRLERKHRTRRVVSWLNEFIRITSPEEADKVRNSKHAHKIEYWITNWARVVNPAQADNAAKGGRQIE